MVVREPVVLTTFWAVVVLATALVGFPDALLTVLFWGLMFLDAGPTGKILATRAKRTTLVEAGRPSGDRGSAAMAMESIRKCLPQGNRGAVSQSFRLFMIQT